MNISTSLNTSKITTILSVGLLTFGLSLSTAFAQSPEKMSYQAVVRDAGNALIATQPVGMQISILQGGVTGTVVYVETQTPTTNANGLVSLEIGTGTVVSGDFTTIDWANDTYFIQTETDPTGGTTYTITGTSQLMSVPYALYAKTSGSSTPGPQGPIGNTGLQGVAGNNGANGTNGTAGATGNTGATGAQGIQGLTGTTGAASTVAGPQGPIGVAGPQGTIGNTGLQGTAGNDGTNGTNGTAGATGNTGATGAQGIQGLTGATGAASTVAGPQGTIGNTGLQGAAGNDGTNGTNGIAGVTGNTGATGAQGIQGLTGATGAASTVAGPQGPIGVTGPQGPGFTNGTQAGDMSYWNGTAWVVVATTIYEAATLQMIGGVPTWTGGTPPTGAVGDFRDGGIVFWLDGNGGGLVVSAVEQIAQASWGCYGTSIAGAIGTAIGTGAANTTAIEAACVTTGTAADLCANLTLNGYSDWFLPSKYELIEIYNNRIAINTTAANNGGTNFTSIYWSSTEGSSNSAWNYNFNNGYSDSNYKFYTYRVRAIRAF